MAAYMKGQDPYAGGSSSAGKQEHKRSESWSGAPRSPGNRGSPSAASTRSRLRRNGSASTVSRASRSRSRGSRASSASSTRRRGRRRGAAGAGAAARAGPATAVADILPAEPGVLGRAIEWHHGHDVVLDSDDQGAAAAMDSPATSTGTGAAGVDGDAGTSAASNAAESSGRRLVSESMPPKRRSMPQLRAVSGHGDFPGSFASSGPPDSDGRRRPKSAAPRTTAASSPGPHQHFRHARDRGSVRCKCRRFGRHSTEQASPLPLFPLVCAPVVPWL